MQRLLIYIPTFNRPSELRKQLEILEVELKDHLDVDLIVNDNCSTNYSFHEFIRDYKIPNSIFRQNAANIGGNANISLSYTFWSNQQYLWILSDNDTLQPGGLEIVKKALVPNPDLLSINNLPIVQEAYQCQWSSGWNAPISEGIGLISGTIIKRDVFLKFCINAFLFHNSSFPHLAVILAALKELQTISMIRIPMKDILLEHNDMKGSKGTYELSFAGFLQISHFLPSWSKNQFVKQWLKEYNSDFLRQRIGMYSFVYDGTESLIRKSSHMNNLRLFYYKLRYRITTILSGQRKIWKKIVRKSSRTK